jgi:hypothetical protein
MTMRSNKSDTTRDFKFWVRHVLSPRNPSFGLDLARFLAQARPLSAQPCGRALALHPFASRS